jgi:tetratricopeptide (TPR) repeat protein
MLAKLFKKNKNPAVSSTTQTAPEDLFRSRGDDNVQNGDYDRAVMMYDEALRYASTDTTILLSRSFAQMMLTPPRLDLALRDADTAIQHCSTSWQAWSQKGETHLKMGDINRAEEAFVNAVRFAKGADKLNPQRSLADIQSRRSPASPAAPSGTSVKSTPSTPFSEISASTPPVSHPSPATATSSTTEPTTTTSGSAPSNMQTSGKLIPFSYSKPTCSNVSILFYYVMFSFNHSTLPFPSCYADIFRSETWKGYLSLCATSAFKYTDVR